MIKRLICWLWGHDLNLEQMTAREKQLMFIKDDAGDYAMSTKIVTHQCWCKRCQRFVRV